MHRNRNANSTTPPRVSPAASGVRCLTLLFLLCCAGWLHGQTAKPVIHGPYPAKAGETCSVCNSPVTSADVAYVVNGQRVAMQRSMEAEFLADPIRFTRSTRPEGMLFSGNPTRAPNWTLFLAGTWVLAGLLFGSLSAQLALARGRPALPWFVAGLLANVLAWAILRARPAATVLTLPARFAKVTTTAEPVPCPTCGARNHPLATACLHCGSSLTPTHSSEAQRARHQERTDA